jgi:hypothetical protein
MRLLPCVVVALAGCAQLFGIDDTTGNASGASLQIERVSIGASVVKSPQDLSMENATFYVADTSGTLTPTPGVQSAIDTWTADVKGVPIVQFSLPDEPMPLQHLWELPVAQVQGSFVAFEHPNPQPPSMTASEVLNITLPAPYAGTETFQVEAIGAWMYHTLGGAELPALMAPAITTTVPYSGFAQMTSSPPSKITAADSVLVLRYAGAQLNGVYQTSFDQNDTMDSITGTMVAVAPDHTLTAPIDLNSLASRYSPARPAVTGLGAAYSISAAPGAANGSPFGPQLMAGGIAMTDTMVMASYGNPFESLGWQGMLTVSTSEHRTFTPTGGTALTLGATLYEVASAASPGAIDMRAPMPEQVNVDANQLVTDGANVMFDVGVAHTITMLTENRPANLYTLTLADITTPGMFHNVFVALATQPKFTIPPLTFQAQHTYVATVGTIAGDYPNASTGDLRTHALPFSFAGFDGGVFTVNP